jgi:hypothetical protein
VHGCALVVWNSVTSKNAKKKPECIWQELEAVCYDRFSSRESNSNIMLMLFNFLISL